MRDDLDKVIIERARHNSADGVSQLKGVDRRRYKLTGKCGFGWSGGGTKSFNDILRPLYRFMDSRVGKPWNDTWSELCQTYNRKSISGWHLIDDHIRGMVRIGGPLHEWRTEPYYVDDAGLLQEDTFHWSHQYQQKRPYLTNKVLIENKHFFSKSEDGAWWYVELRSLKPYSVFIGFDPVTRKPEFVFEVSKYRREAAVDMYGAELEPVGNKRMLSRKEMELYGLKLGMDANKKEVVAKFRESIKAKRRKSDKNHFHR